MGNSVVSGWNGLRGYALTQNGQKRSLAKDRNILSRPNRLFNQGRDEMQEISGA